MSFTTILINNNHLSSVILTAAQYFSKAFTDHFLHNEYFDQQVSFQFIYNLLNFFTVNNCKV